MRLQRRHGRIQNRRLVVRRAVHGRLDHRLVPHDAVAEFDAVDLAVRVDAAIDRIGAVITNEGDLLAAALELEHHVVANPVAHHVRIGDARTETQRVQRSQLIQIVAATAYQLVVVATIKIVVAVVCGGQFRCALAVAPH